MLQVHRTWAARAHSTAEAAFHTDMRLSRNARGLLAELLALPDDAPRDIRSLAGTGPDGYMGTASGFKELERFGYVTRQVNRHKTTGQMWTEVHIYDTPLESPESEVRDPGCQCSGDPVIHPNGGTYGEVNTSLPEPKAPDPEPELPELHWEPDVLPPTRAEVELDSAHGCWPRWAGWTDGCRSARTTRRGWRLTSWSGSRVGRRPPTSATRSRAAYRTSSSAPPASSKTA